MSVVAVVGLGYVGLPLAVEFGKKMTTIGYDLSVEKSSITVDSATPPAKYQRTTSRPRRN